MPKCHFNKNALYLGGCFQNQIFIWKLKEFIRKIIKINVFNLIRNINISKEFTQTKKWSNIKQKEILSEIISVDYNTSENVDIVRKQVQGKSKLVDFAENLQITDNRRYTDKKNKLQSDVFKSLASSTEEFLESGKTIYC